MNNNKESIIYNIRQLQMQYARELEEQMKMKEQQKYKSAYIQNVPTNQNYNYEEIEKRYYLLNIEKNKCNMHKNLRDK